MTVRWDSVSSGGNAMRVYVGVPDGGRQRPGVVVAHHGPGLDGFVQDVVHRLFRRGYAVAAPDLYHRQPADVADTMARVALLTDDQIVDDMNAAIGHVRSLADGPIGVVGFCMGGRIAYLMAAASPAVAASAVFYGGNVMTAWSASASPFERTQQIGCPLIGFFGDDDPNPSRADVDRLDLELTRLGKPHEFHRYADAGHAFQNFLNADCYRPRAARGSWDELLAFLAHHLR